MFRNGIAMAGRQPKPIRLMDREIEPKNPVSTEQWTPEQVAEYLAEKYPQRKMKQKSERVYTWNKRKDEGDVTTAIKLAKEDYLALRLAGKRRTEIGKKICDEFHVSIPTFYKQLDEWGIKEIDAEERALELFNTKSIKADKPSPELVAELKQAIEEAAPTAVTLIVPPTPSTDIDSKPSSEAVEPLKQREPSISNPYYVSRETKAENVQYVTVRIPVKYAEGTPPIFSRDDLLKDWSEQSQKLIVSVWSDMADLFGPGDYTAQVQQFIERKVAQL